MQIKKLKIYTANLAAQSQFYAEILGLEKLGSTQKTVSFKMGKSVLEIESSLSATPYHFAINIPSNQEMEALNWLKDRLEILKDGSNEIHDFVAWNAKAMYFYDPDQNIVEFIARKNLDHRSETAFDQNALLEISEIGLPTDDIEKEFNRLNKNLGLEIYSGNFDRFCAIGDENGLFICVDKNIKDWFPTNDKAYSSNFEMILRHNEKAYEIVYKNEKLKTGVSKS
jgi:catechol-2,3-dioxygenase